MYTRPEHHDKIDVKGIQLVRRDSCPLVKDVSNAILDAVMFSKDVGVALDAAKTYVRNMLDGRYPTDKFVVSKALRSDYKNDKQPHLYVAKKLAARRGFPVPSGSRVPYVFVEDLDQPDRLQAERAEDPTFVEENGLPLDMLYYLEHQLVSPMCALLELLVPDPQEVVLGDATTKPLIDALKKRRDDAMKKCKRLRKNHDNRQMEITSFFKVFPTNN